MTDLSQVILNEEDSPVLDGTEKVTLGLALRRLMLSDTDHNRQNLTAEAKITRYEFYLKLKQANGTLELSPEDKVFLRQAALSFPTLIAGQIRAMLA